MESFLDEHGFADIAGSKPCSADHHAIYRSLAGSFTYIATRRRPELALVTSMLPLCSHKPKLCKIIAAIRNLTYINKTKNKKMKLKSGDNDQPTSFVDTSSEIRFKMEDKVAGAR